MPDVGLDRCDGHRGPVCCEVCREKMKVNHPPDTEDDCEVVYSISYYDIIICTWNMYT